MLQYLIFVCHCAYIDRFFLFIRSNTVKKSQCKKDDIILRFVKLHKRPTIYIIHATWYQRLLLLAVAAVTAVRLCYLKKILVSCRAILILSHFGNAKIQSSKVCLIINQVNAFAWQCRMENNKKWHILKKNYNLNTMMEN